MAKKQPLYPHVTKSQRAAQGGTFADHEGYDIYCYLPYQSTTIGIYFIYASSRQKADEIAAAVDYYKLGYLCRWDELAAKIKEAGVKDYLGEVGY